MRVLLVEPFYGGSHRAWADGYRSASAHDVTLVTHPARFWRWRLRGSAVTLAAEIRDHVATNGRPDVVLVSSLVDLASLLGLTRDVLGATPVVYYLHENQIAYPHPDATDEDAAWRTWISCLAADRVLTNSDHHRAELAAALPELLSATPDLPQDRFAADVVAAIEVVPVGIDPVEPAARRPEGPPTVIWNHRWDPDKRPDVFVRAVQRIRAEGHELRVVLAGADHWEGERRRQNAAEALGDVVLAVGPFTDEEYRSHLASSDVVVSVAEHDYFGIAVVEAIAAGCVPVLPRSLAYPELVPAAFHDAVFYEPGGFRRMLQNVVADLEGARARVSGLADAMAAYHWDRIAPRLDRALEHAVGSS